MSMENLQNFLKTVSTDEEASQRVWECSAKGKEAVVEYAAELGFEITADDLAEFEKNLTDAVIGRISFSDTETAGMRNLKKFILLSEENDEIKNELDRIGVESAQAIIDYAKTLGYEFSAEDLTEIGKELMGKSDELSDEDLEKVAGGFCTTTIAGFVIGAAAVAGVMAVSLALGAAAVGVCVLMAKSE